jgi:hypothetical protein
LVVVFALLNGCVLNDEPEVFFHPMVNAARLTVVDVGPY